MATAVLLIKNEIALAVNAIAYSLRETCFNQCSELYCLFLETETFSQCHPLTVHICHKDDFRCTHPGTMWEACAVIPFFYAVLPQAQKYKLN